MAEPPLRVACIGECMIELTQRGAAASGGDGRTLDLRFGGDTLNTAVYMTRRLAQAGQFAIVDYVTALGDDPYSDWMLQGWKDEGVGTGLVARLPGRLPGLYAIRTAEGGERSFYYWRSAAAARDLFRAPLIADIKRDLRAYDLVYLSGITLSIYDEASRAELFALLDDVRRNGALVAFDTNYRPRGWPDTPAARLTMTEAWRRADIALPTFDDERALFGDTDATATIARLRGFGVREIVVKRDRQPCLIDVAGERSEVPPLHVPNPMDTTAAGDSFNAAYLTARLLDRPSDDAARAGHRVAAAVIQHQGAIIPKDAMPGE